MRNRRMGAALEVAVSVAAIVFGGMSCSGKGSSAGVAVSKAPAVMLGSTQAGGHGVEFYIDYGNDSAVLGFALRDTGKPARYFPVYGSTHRGMPPVTLNVYLSDTEEEMWVQSSWPGYAVLAYYRFGDERCMTCYGEVLSCDVPTPQSIGGGSGRFPPMDPARVKKALTLVHP